VAPKDKEIDLLPYRIEGLLADAIRHEGMAENATEFRDRLWHEDQMNRKLDQAYWAEKRLEFLLAGL
jgi:hypothetical protein